jgi:hypothetical protein
MERSAAHSYSAPRVAKPIHLAENFVRAHMVWVMGHLANNAVANLDPTYPRVPRKPSKQPFPAELLPGSRYFISAYFTRWNKKDIPSICRAFANFASLRGLHARK